MKNVWLVAITLFVSTVAVTNNDIYEGNKFVSSLEDSKSPTSAQEVAAVGPVGKVYDYRSDNGLISPLSYISVPQRRYRKFRDAIREFQNFPSVLQRVGNSSVSGDGTTKVDNESANTNTSKAMNISGYSLPIITTNSNTVEGFRRQFSFYRDNYGALPTIRYVMAPEVANQAYGDEVSLFQIPSAVDEISSYPGLKNSTSSVDYDTEDNKTFESISSNDTLKNQQLHFIQLPSLLNTTVENSITEDMKQSKMSVKEILDATILHPEHSESRSSISFDLFSNKSERNDQSLISHSSSAFNPFVPYWLGHHPSLISTDMSSSYFVLNPVVYPIVPFYHHLILG